jgi:hypothetical protein
VPFDRVKPIANEPAAVVGQTAHIVAHGDQGPRADPSYPSERRNLAENLVLLCPTHHVLVDAQDSVGITTLDNEGRRSTMLGNDAATSGSAGRRSTGEMLVSTSMQVFSATRDAASVAPIRPKRSRGRRRCFHETTSSAATGCGADVCERKPVAPLPAGRASASRQSNRAALRGRTRAFVGSGRPVVWRSDDRRPSWSPHAPLGHARAQGGLSREPLPAHTVRSATVGGIRDARTAGIRPANAPIRTAEAMPPDQASAGITMAQFFELA